VPWPRVGGEEPSSTAEFRRMPRGAEVDNQVTALAETRTPNLHRATSAQQKSADGRVTTEVFSPFWPLRNTIFPAGGRTRLAAIRSRVVFSGSVAAGQRHALVFGNLQRHPPERVEPAVPLFDFFEPNSCGRESRRRHWAASRKGKSHRVLNAQPWTRSRSTFSARARSCAYSVSAMVPA
jgi:hypothetical protein